jgi:mannose/fructose/sorbose-specific phosphotransferase system IIB component
VAIVLVRVDDRLIHGQITTAWIADSKATRIVISSDEVANDPLQQTIISITAPPRTPIDVFSAEKTIQMAESGAWDSERIFILCKYPNDALPLVQAGLEFKEVNVGNVGGMTQHLTGSRKQIFKSIAVTEDDVKAFREMLAAGVDFEARVTPRDRRVDFAELLEKA